MWKKMFCLSLLALPRAEANEVLDVVCGQVRMIYSVHCAVLNQGLDMLRETRENGGTTCMSVKRIAEAMEPKCRAAVQSLSALRQQLQNGGNRSQLMEIGSRATSEFSGQRNRLSQFRRRAETDCDATPTARNEYRESWGRFESCVSELNLAYRSLAEAQPTVQAGLASAGQP